MKSAKSAGQNTAGIYIHIPFCIQKCPYCDFSSFSGMENLADDYIDALLIEYKYYKDKFHQIHKVTPCMRWLNQRLEHRLLNDGRALIYLK